MLRWPDTSWIPVRAIPLGAAAACVAVVLAFAGPAGAQEAEELPLSRDQVDGLERPPAFCREGGEGVHPHFGPEFCAAFRQEGPAAAAPDAGAAAHRSITSHPRYDEETGEIPHFCQTGEGHPKFGGPWCTMTEEEWEEYREEQQRRDLESGRSPPR